jgi:hypothetical protein
MAAGSLLVPSFTQHTAASCSLHLRSSLLSSALWLQPLVLLPTAAIHTSAVLERARQSTRARKRKVAVENKKKKEERLRKNPPPLPKKVQLMLIAKGLGEFATWSCWNWFSQV